MENYSFDSQSYLDFAAEEVTAPLWQFTQSLQLKR